MTVFRTSTIRSFLNRHIIWSRGTFGEKYSHKRICNHIRMELEEIEASPRDLTEWVDVMFLAIDGAWRAGYTKEQIEDAMHMKQRINRERKWLIEEDNFSPNVHV